MLRSEIADLTPILDLSLKLQIRRLERELSEARSAQPYQTSNVLVLKNLLEDAKRAKERYEREYLDEHKASLGLKAQLAQIRSGKGGDRSVLLSRSHISLLVN
jgi:protein HOOK3